MKEFYLQDGWQLRQEPLDRKASDYRKIINKEDGWIKATVPGDIHMDLIREGIIEEPLTGLNSFDSEWVEERSWWFKKELLLDKDLGNYKKAVLEIDGLDGIADIFLNGKHLGRHISAFRPFTQNVKDILASGKNLLAVRLTSKGDQKDYKSYEELAPFVLCENEIVAPKIYGTRGEKLRAYIRKPQYTFGWDGFPRVPTCSISGGARLKLLSSINIKEVYVCSEIEDSRALINIKAAIENLDPYSSLEAKLLIEIEDEGKNTIRKEKPVFLRSGYNYISHAIAVEDPVLWWPAGMGRQHLYRIRVSVSFKEETISCSKIRHGIRKIDLVLKSDMEDLKGFKFKINGEDIYCKGASWAPPDSIYGRLDREKYQGLIREAKEANFNMLRVWGGGRYEPDYFYELCDELGILVLQDFMFACSAYPDSEDWFVQEVSKEVDYQTKRLRNHACLAMFAGNNENHWILDFFFKRKTEGGLFLYNNLIPEIIEKNCPRIQYWNSLPYGGEDPNSLDVGNQNLWLDFVQNWDNMEKRIDPKGFDAVDVNFVVEFGYMGPCMPESTRDYLNSPKFDMSSRKWKHHTNSRDKGLIESSIKNYYGIKDPSPGQYLLYGGLCQGQYLEYALDALRAKVGCYGCLFWVYNDGWGEVGWSIMDYYLRRKISYYFVKRAYSDIRFIIRPSGSKFIIICSNNTDRTLSGDLQYGYISFDSSKRKVSSSKINIAPFSRGVCKEIDKMDYDPFRGCIYAELKDYPEIAPAVYRGLRINELELDEPELKVTGFKNSREDASFCVEADKFAHAVHFMLPDGFTASDQFFDLVPGIRRKIIVKGKGLKQNMLKMDHILAENTGSY